MRNWITLLMTCLVAGSFSYANANTGQIDFEAGYRRDNISWNIKSPSDSPTVSASQRFKDLDIFQLGINGRTTIGYNFYLRANAYWGWILDGDYKSSFDVNTSDSENSNFNIGFAQNSRTVIDDKYVYGIGAAIGYPFYFCDCTTVIAPVIGYAFDEQSVQLDGRGFNFGNDLFASDTSANDCNACDNGCCRQTFNSRWYGPFVGVDFNYRPYNECWNFYADVEYHWGSFRGRKNHEQETSSGYRGNRSSHDATGWLFAAGAEYDLCNCWTVGASVKFQDWKASRHHRICQNFDSADTDANTCQGSCNNHQRTNHKWHSYAINVTVGRQF